MKLVSLAVVITCCTQALAAERTAAKISANESLGKRACKSDKDPRHSKRLKSVIAFDVPFFRDHAKNGPRFFAVACEANSFGSFVLKVAFDLKDTLYRVPDELPKLMKSSDITISDSDNAIEYAKAYVELDARNEVVISSSRDIVGYGEKPVFGNSSLLTKDQEAAISPPKAVFQDSHFEVTLFSWSSRTGALSKAVLKISPDGATYIDRTLIARSVGKPSPSI